MSLAVLFHSFPLEGKVWHSVNQNLQLALQIFFFFTQPAKLRPTLVRLLVLFLEYCEISQIQHQSVNQKCIALCCYIALNQIYQI